MSNNYTWMCYIIDTSHANILKFTQTCASGNCGTAILDSSGNVLVNDDHNTTLKSYSFDCTNYDEVAIIGVNKGNIPLRIIDISLE